MNADADTEFIYDINSVIYPEFEDETISTTISPFGYFDDTIDDFFPQKFFFNITAFNKTFNYTFEKLLGAQNDYTSSDVYIGLRTNATAQNFSQVVVSKI